MIGECHIPYVGEDRAPVPTSAERERIMASWAQSVQLRQSHARGDPVAWLLGRRDSDTGQPGWFDHGTRWLSNGKPHSLLGQPYHLGPRDVAELARLESRNLHVWVTSWPSWHYPGAVLSVLVSRSDIRPWSSLQHS